MYVRASKETSHISPYCTQILSNIHKATYLSRIYLCIYSIGESAYIPLIENLIEFL